jgi:tRNA (guanine37-N1)-methyltransferase
MRFDIICANPDILSSSLKHGLISRAIKRNVAEVYLHNLRDYAEGKYRQIDDEPYGGGAGMVLKPEPFFKCIKKLISERDYDEIFYLTPQGKQIDQKYINRLSLINNIIIICGHFKGIDERVIENFVTNEISVGNYVLSSGEVASIVFIDAIIRLIPGSMNDSESAMTDSFQTDSGFDAPLYTRPEEIDGKKVPGVLLSGNHTEIEKWREMKAREKYMKFKNKI